MKCASSTTTATIVPDGEIGNIAVRRPDPVMFLGYWNNDEATREKYVGDWLLTGDTGMSHPGGYVQFVGRNDDVITSAGYRIGPGPDRGLSARASRRAARGGRRRTRSAAHRDREGFHRAQDRDSPAASELKRELQDHVKVRLAAHEYPREVAFVDSLPMTTTGKIIRRELRELG